MENINELVGDFKQSLVDDGKGPKTVLSYVGDVKGFLQWLDEKKLTLREN